tara:strand:- start:15195 stop:15356 length:162 start_codon:yes stop_codon:yes gene_type:complete
MAKELKHIDKVYDILVDCRKAFSALQGDSIVSLKKLNRLCAQIDRVIGGDDGE